MTWLDNHFELIEVTDEERVNVEINTFTLSPQKVVMLERSKGLASLLESKGIQPILVNYSEVTKLPNSFCCTTLPTERVSYNSGLFHAKKLLECVEIKRA